MTRTRLDNAFAAAREADTFVVPALDRLARNTEGALEVIRLLTAVMSWSRRVAAGPHA